jgi:spore germination cell wall hydrolase CwlJ-like protein
MRRDIDKPFYALNPAEIIALIADAEARGEEEAGEIAVMWTIKNRTIAGHWFLDKELVAAGLSTFHAVALKNGIPKNCTIPVYQYSCLKDGTPDRAHMMKIALNPERDKLLFVDIAWSVINGEIPDPTKGATYYYNPDLCTPFWASTFMETAMIGHHRFERP